MPGDVLRRHPGQHRHLETPRLSAAAAGALELGRVQELPGLDVVEEGLAVEDAALAREEEGEVVRLAEAGHGVTLARVEADQAGETGAQQRGELSPGHHIISKRRGEERLIN